MTTIYDAFTYTGKASLCNGLVETWVSLIKIFAMLLEEPCFQIHYMVLIMNVNGKYCYMQGLVTWELFFRFQLRVKSVEPDVNKVAGQLLMVPKRQWSPRQYCLIYTCLASSPGQNFFPSCASSHFLSSPNCRSAQSIFRHQRHRPSNIFPQPTIVNHCNTFYPPHHRL